MSGTKDNLDALYDALAALTDPADVKALLADLCTAGETEQMACRLRAAMLLLDGKTYSQITEETDISSATLSRVSSCVRRGSGGYSKVWQNIHGED